MYLFDANQISTTTYETNGGIERFLSVRNAEKRSRFQVWGLGKINAYTCPGKGILESRIHLQTKEEYQHEVDEEYKELLPWDDRVASTRRRSRSSTGIFVCSYYWGSAQSKRSRISEAEPGPGGVDARELTQERSISFEHCASGFALGAGDEFRFRALHESARSGDIARHYTYSGNSASSPFLIDTILHSRRVKNSITTGEAWRCPLPGDGLHQR